MENNNLKIRLLEEKDLSQLSKVYAKTFNKAYPDENWEDKSARDFLDYWYKTQPDLFFVASINDIAIGGVVGIIKPWWNGLSFSDGELFVDPDFQNQGIGKKLFKEVIKKAQEKYNVSGVQGITNGRKEFPLVWYEKIGLKKSGYVHLEGDAKKILENLK